jgi:hypothetical protein
LFPLPRKNFQKKISGTLLINSELNPKLLAAIFIIYGPEIKINASNAVILATAKQLYKLHI